MDDLEIAIANRAIRERDEALALVARLREVAEWARRAVEVQEMFHPAAMSSAMSSLKQALEALDD